MCLQPFISPLRVYSFARIYGWIWIAYSITPFQAGVFWILRQGWFIPAYLCEFNYKCFAQLRSMTAPRAILVIYLWSCVGSVEEPHWLRAGFKQPVAITGQTWPLDRQQLAREVNRKCFFKDHNHVLSSNYRTRQKIGKHMAIMGQKHWS